MKNNIIKIKGHVQHYSWGSYDKESIVYTFSKDSFIKRWFNKQPYAEFWISTHIKGPAFVNYFKTLNKWLKEKKIPELNFIIKYNMKH